MLEIIDIQERAVLHSFFIDDVATDGELVQYIRAPLVELRGSHRVDAITDRMVRFFSLGFNYLVRFWYILKRRATMSLSVASLGKP